MAEPQPLDLNLRDFQYVVLPPEASDVYERTLVDKAYDLWLQVWSEAFNQLGVSTPLRSDDFSRADQIGILLFRGEVVGSTSFVKLNFSRPYALRDSSVSSWSDDRLAELKRSYADQSVLVATYFSLCASWRKPSMKSLNAKELIAALTCEYFYSSDCAAMIATVRNDRGMHRVCYNLNATPVVERQEKHGVAVDLVLWDKSQSLFRRHTTPMANEARMISTNPGSFLDSLRDQPITSSVA